MPRNSGVMPTTGMKSDAFAQEKKPKRPFEERLKEIRIEKENLEKIRLRKLLSYRQALRLHALSGIVATADAVQAS